MRGSSPTFASFEEILGIEKSADYRRKAAGTVLSILSHIALMVLISIAGWLAKEKTSQAAQKQPSEKEYELVELARIAPPPSRGNLPRTPIVPPPSSIVEGNAPVEREGQKIGAAKQQIAGKRELPATEISIDKKPASSPAPPAAEKLPVAVTDPKLIAPPPPTPPQEAARTTTPSPEELKRALDSTLKASIDPTSPSPSPRATNDKDMSVGIEGLNLGIYRERLEHRIKRSWWVPTYTNQLNRRATITVYFDLYRNGQIKITGYTSTGNRIMDRAAINAVTSISPYDPLPPTVTLEKIPLYAVFNY